MQDENLVGCKEHNITISAKLCDFVDNHDREYTTFQDAFCVFEFMSMADEDLKTQKSLLPCLGCLFPPPRPPRAAPSPSPSNVKSQSVGFCGGSPHQEGPPHLMPDITCTFIHLPKYSSRYRFSDHSNIFCQARSLNKHAIY